MRHSAVKTLVGVAIIAVGTPIVATVACGRTLLYQRTSMTETELSELANRPGWHRINLAAGDGVQLVGLIRVATEPSKTWLLFFGGNAMNLANGQRVLEEFAAGRSWGLALFAYRGYDGSGGTPTEESLKRDAIAQVKHLERRFSISRQQLVLVGMSLGTGIAAPLAARLADLGGSPAGLILLSPYTSMAAVFDEQVPLIPVGWAAADRYDTESEIADIRNPVLIIHGTKDSLIGPKHGRQLATQLGDRVTFVELENRAHNDLWNDTRTLLAIRRFVGD